LQRPVHPGSFRQGTLVPGWMQGMGGADHQVMAALARTNG